MIAFFLATMLASAAPIVAVEEGRLQGEVTPDGRALFRGIPFAAPPVGPLRWRAPRAARHWTGLRHATRPAPACPQIDYGWNHDAAAHQSEDCLYLDVATPSLSPPQPLPVMVWIHGGGNRAGSGAGTIDSPLVRRGIVLVSIQYRLSALGFLSHPALGKHSGNYGLMDQQAALKWVRANIRQFGGNPANVTIFGESAGAQDVGLQLLSPGARGLFAKAIEESGTPGFGLPPRSLAENERIGEIIAAHAGAHAHVSAAQLRAIPATTLIAASEATGVPDLDDDSFIWLQAVTDGKVLKETPAYLLSRGDGRATPLIIGNNINELPLYGPRRYAVRAGFGSTADAAMQLYDLTNAQQGNPALDLRIANDLMFRCPSLEVAARRSPSGMTWHYQFSVTGPGTSPVSHGSEIRYVLGKDGDKADAKAPLAAYWVNFARTGDPNGLALPFWPRFSPSRTTLEFTDSGARRVQDLARPICSLRSAP